MGFWNGIVNKSFYFNVFFSKKKNFFYFNFCMCVCLSYSRETYVKDKQCPRTRLHKKLLEYKTLTSNQYDHMYWVLFQVGIFDEEILKHDVSTITTSFNNPKQSIFLNIT